MNKNVKNLIVLLGIVSFLTSCEDKNISSNKIVKKQAYKEEIINGYKLPPQPDPKINNSTLLGIDSNNNGVRDDVERYIYKTYTEPLEIGIFMQSARAYQKQIENPSLAHETVKYSDDALSCSFYLLDTEQIINDEYQYYKNEKKLEKILLNTIERHIAYQKYNSQFNGQVLSIPKASKEKCEFDENGNFGGSL